MGTITRDPEQCTALYHPSLLPLHRGCAAINWAVINGDSETGISIFYPDDGIDTGPVLLQEKCDIGPDETVTTLYFKKLYPMGVDALRKCVDLVASGEARKTAQNHALATYYPPCKAQHAAIRWYRPAEELYALIRGCNPQPGAHTTYEGETLKLFDVTLSRTPEPGMHGTVLRVDASSFDVRLNGGVLTVKRVLAAGGKKEPAGEWAARVGLTAGYRFR